MSYEKYVFLDESGDLGFNKKSSKYFIITILVTSNKKIIEKKLKTYKRKLLRKKKYKKLKELKANNSDDKIRFNVLDIINENNIEIYTIILNKEKLLDNLKEKKTKVYNYLTNLILTECDDLNGKSVHFIIDKRVKKKIIRDDLDNYIKKEHPEIRFNISHYDSSNSNGLQLVDFVSWSIFRYYEFNDDRFYYYIREKITFQKKFLFDRKKQ
jgi:hypothetical protein